MGNIAATLSLNVPAITALCTGQRGSIIYAASGTPTNIFNPYLGNPGLSGDYYVDTATGFYYGPKTTTWPTIPLFSLNIPVSAYPLVFAKGSTSLVYPTYGNNTVSLKEYNLGILGGINNTLSGTNSFIIGSNITANLSGFTVVNNLSGNTLYDINGNSIQWNTAFTYANTTSAGFVAAVTLVDSTSANWNAAYSALTATSGSWNAAYTNVNSSSGNWNTSYSVVSSLAYLTYTLNGALSSIIPSKGTNVASGSASNIDGGTNNYVTSNYSSILGGTCNLASGNYSNITGGFSGLATGCYSNIAGGASNTASGYGSTVGGGTNNNAIGYNSAIAAGAYNISSGCSSFVGGGRSNIVSGNKSGIASGLNNTASGHYSFIAAGSANNTNNYQNTFILGTSLIASQANFTYVNNISSQGIVADQSGSSTQWNSAYTNVNSNSANWTNTYTGNVANSGNWSNVYTFINTATASTLPVNNLSVGNNLTVSNSASVGQSLTVTGTISSTGSIAAGSNWNLQTTGYSLRDSDCGGIVALSSASALTLTIPSNNFRQGYQSTIMRLGTGSVTIAVSPGVVLSQAYSLSALAATYSAATVVYSGNATTGWILFGDLA